jgi:DNA-binding response OmpR family regulator
MLTMNGSKKIRIAVVEDYEPHREELVHLLRLEGFDVLTADSGTELDRLIILAPVDLVILDLNLPGEDGLSIAARLQQHYPETRIVMLTGRARGIDRVQGYEAGADIYLTKPQRPREIIAVIRSMTRRIFKGTPEPSHSTSTWSLSLRDSSIRSPQGDVVVLTRRDAGLLHRLHLAPNQTLDMLALLEHLELPETQAGKTQVVRILSRLRLKMQPHASGITCIKAHRKDGYALCLEIQVV